MLFYTVTVTISFFLQRTTLFRGFTNLMFTTTKHPRMQKIIIVFQHLSLPTKNKKTMKILKFKD